MEENENMKNIWKNVCKTFGSDGLFEADGSFISDAAPESTGSPAFDDILGIWGYPKGRLIQIAGKQQSGKTLLSLMAIREWQRKAPHNWALFIDAEFTFQPSWAESLGIDLSRLKVIKKNSAIEIFSILNGGKVIEKNSKSKSDNDEKSDAKKPKKGILDIVIENGGADKSGLGIIVLDSVAAISPPQEIASDVGKVNMAPLPRFLPPELRKITPLLANSQVILLALNHIRTNLGVMYGNPEITPGGNSWDHHCSVMIKVFRQDGTDSKIFDESNDERIGHKIKIKIEKNKVGPSYRECSVNIEYLKGFVERYKEICDLGLKYNVINKNSKMYYSYNGILFKGKENFYNYFKDNIEECEKIYYLVKEAKKSGVIPIIETNEEEEIEKNIVEEKGEQNVNNM